MVGTIVIIVILLLAPIGILMSSTAFVAAFSAFLNRDVDINHKGSELLDLAETGMSVKPDQPQPGYRHLREGWLRQDV